jgi:DNA-binding FrmR family transcriptional regulator
LLLKSLMADYRRFAKARGEIDSIKRQIEQKEDAQ